MPVTISSFTEGSLGSDRGENLIKCFLADTYLFIVCADMQC